ncbi:MAG: hypothetical protein KDA80_13490, partial [Planctomycetaceae bacterium]|nr:hypothetical protein [Planctomycetaceae bacterium]
QSPAIRDGNTPSLGIPWLRVSLGMGAPLILGFALVGWQNFALTGNLWTTGYTRYNELYTPSHVFGFHTRVDPDAPLPKTLLKDYDAWPADLNMKLAMRNVWNRLNGTLKWHLSLPLLAMSTGYLLFSIHGQPRPIQLLFLSVVCLHVAHIPYWLDGILQHHYVFESGFLLVILFSVVSGQLLSMALAQQRWLFPIWWTMLVTLTVCLNQFAVSKVGIPKIQQGLRQILFAAPHYHRFEQLLASAELKTPALVVVLPTAGDLHVEYVRNLPPFDSEILVGMDRSEQFTPQSIVELFPERTVYFYDSRTSEFTLGTERGESDD